jgi:hypothetical protein
MWEDLREVRVVFIEVRIWDCSVVVVWYCFGSAIGGGAAQHAASFTDETAGAAAADDSGEIMV